MTFSKNNPISWLASLKLTVVLLAMAMYLIFVGTLAQVELGIWQVVEKYFRSLYVQVPIDVFRSLLYPGSETTWRGSHPFPGGFLIIGLLLVNLVAAHAVRFKVTGKGSALLLGYGLILLGTVVTAYTVIEPNTSAAIQQNVMLMLGIWAVPMTVIGVGCYMVFGNRKAGIVMVHSGLILMLVGEIITGIGAKEGQMWIVEKGSSNKIIDIRESEIAFVRDLGNGKHEHIVIPQAMIESADDEETKISSSDLPMTVRIDAWMENSDLTISFDRTNPTELDYTPKEIPVVTGTEQRSDRPSVMASLYHGETRIGQYLLSTYDSVPPVRIDVDGTAWEVSLRFKETHLPYTIQLVDFRHDKFTGTTTAKNFSSSLRLQTASEEEGRDAFIKMNQPLRYDNKAFFQSNYFYQQPGQLNRNLGTIMQVADNPGAWVPYLSCVVVSIGLCMHFVVSLLKYGRRANASG